MLDQANLRQTDLKPVHSPIAAMSQVSLCSGTTVLTLKGEKAVEDLVPGDRIITRDCGTTVLNDLVMTEDDVTPIRILAGSLGHTRPDRDMIVGPETLIHIRDWRAPAMFGATAASVQARQLVDDEFVAEMGTTRMRFATLCFDRSHIIYADGLELRTTGE